MNYTIAEDVSQQFLYKLYTCIVYILGFITITLKNITQNQQHKMRFARIEHGSFEWDFLFCKYMGLQNKHTTFP